MTERATALRDRVLCSRHLGDPRAGEIHQESLAQTEGEPQVLRDAKASAHYCRQQEVTIQDGELIVGTRPGLSHDPEPLVMATFGRRDWQPPDGFWPVPDDVRHFWSEGMLAPAGNHTTLDYETVFEIGFVGLIERVNERLARLEREEPDDTEKRDFLVALRIVAEGHIDLSNRYADHAEALAEAEDDPGRRDELLTIASNCRRVPAHPPTSFWEACQCAWFSFFFLPDAPGRVDQYLYPCYAGDRERGALDREFARELIACLWVKYFESVGAASGVSAHNHLTLGGVKPDGSEASNEVTYLCLDVVEETGLLRPQVGVRWHSGTPMEVIQRGVRALRAGTAIPDFCSDEQIVPALTNVGVSVEDARDFSLSGCHEVIVTGKAQMGSVEGFVNMPKILCMTLGLEPELQSVNGDLSSIGSFDDLWQALEESMEIVAEAAHASSLGRDEAAAQQAGGNLQASLVVGDCIEKCKGYTQGGARYNFCNWDIIGMANLADSLTAIRQLVFEDGCASLEELVAILESNWADHESLRKRVLNQLPHFGNGNGKHDEMMSRLIETFDGIMKRRTPFRGGEYILGTTAGGENMHIEFGRVTGATPDGRRAGEPLTDSIGAAQGRDVEGVTALLNSVASLPHRLLPTATTLNVKLDPTLLNTEVGIEAVSSLIDSHFRSGGQQLQFAFVNREMLEAAKADPDSHRNLMVRVAGYAAPFTSLWEDLQDEIIARTEHAV